jgi:hypothetical protein
VNSRRRQRKIEKGWNTGIFGDFVESVEHVSGSAVKKYIEG